VKRSLAAFALVAFSAAALSGCYTYAVAAREPPPNSQAVAIDRNNPQTSMQWQFLWGLTNEPVFSPIVCNNGEKDAQGNCLHASADPCHGQGIGFYEVNVPWYTLLLTGVTLGVVSGVRTTFYCSTEHGSTSGPQSGSGPQ
jgi:hypothetical protein